MTPIAENIAIWQNSTNECYNRPALNYANFLTADQKAKLERIRQGRMLYDGLHREYFLGENRTQFNFPQMQVGGNITRPYIKFNLLKLVCHKTADLLFGEEPLLRVDDEIQQEKLSDLIDRSSLQQLFYDCAVEACYEAESFLEACVKDGEVYVRRIPADEIFCYGELQPDRQYSKYVRYALQNRGTAEKPIWILLETWYLAGSIERHLWQLDQNGLKMPRELALDQWKLAEGEPPLVAAQPTGIDRNTITWIPGQLARDKAVSRIDGLIELQDELNAKQSQLARVLAKHADPKVSFPQEMADPQGNVPAGHDAMYYSEPDRVPKYITWEAQLDAAYKDRSFCVNALLIANIDVMYIDQSGQEQRGNISRNDEEGSIFFSAAPGTAGGLPKVGETAYIIIRDGLFQWERIARGLADQEMPGRVRSWYRGPTEPFYTHTPDVLLKEGDLDAVMVGMPALEIRRQTGAAGSCNEQAFTVFDKDHWSAADEECSKADKCYTPDSPKAWIRWCQVRQDDRWGKFVHPKFLNSLLSGGTLEVRPSPFSIAEGQQAAGCDAWTSSTGTHIADTGINVSLSLPPEFEPGDFVNFAIKAANGTTLAEGQSSYTNGVLAGDFDDTVPGSDPVEYVYENKQIIVTAGRTRNYPAEFLFLKAVTIFLPDIDPDPLVIPAGSKVIYPPREPDPLASDPNAGPGRWITYPASTHYAFRTGLGFLSEGDKPRDLFVEGHRARFVAQTRHGPGIFAPQQFITPLADGSTNPQAIYYDKAYQGRHTPETEKFLDAMLKGTVTTFTTRSITDAKKNWWRDNWYEGGVSITHEGIATGGSNLTLRDATKAGLALFDPSRGRFKDFVLEVEETPGSEKWHKRPITSSALDGGGFSCVLLYTFPFSTLGKRWRIREPKFILNLHKDEPVKLTWGDGHSEEVIADYSDDDTLYLPAATRPFEAGMSFEILKRKTGPYIRSGGKWSPDASGLMPTVLKRYGYLQLGDIITPRLLKELKQGDDYQVDVIGDASWTSRRDPNVAELNLRSNFRAFGATFDNCENDYNADYVYDEFGTLTPDDATDDQPPGNPIEESANPICVYYASSNSFMWGTEAAITIRRLYAYAQATIANGGLCPIDSNTYFCVKVIAPFTDQSPTPVNPDIIIPTPCGYIYDTFDGDGDHTHEQRWDFDANGDPVQCGRFRLFSAGNVDYPTAPALVDRRSGRLGNNTSLPSRPTAINNLGPFAVISGESSRGWEAVGLFEITRYKFKQLDPSLLQG